MKKSKGYPVVIDKMVAGGYGLGRLESGKVVLVGGVIPGEEVLVRPLEEKKDFVLAAPLHLLTPSTHRVEPPCPLYGECGGCDLQHIEYDMQLYYKKRIVADLFVRHGLPETLMDNGTAAVSASPRQWGYRQRIRLHVDRKNRGIGFHKKHSHFVQEVTACTLAHSLINTVLTGLKNSSLFPDLLASMEAVELYHNPRHDKIILIVHWSRKMRPAERRSIEQLATANNDIEGIYVVEKEGGRFGPFGTSSKDLLVEFTLSLGSLGLERNLHFGIEPGGFSQVNLEQNARMVLTVVQWAKEAGSRNILDLYCGMGNFALPLAMIAQSVCGVDLQRAAIRAAKENARRMSSGNCTFIRNAAEQGARELLQAGRTFDTIILDPPRQGCRELVPDLPSLAATNIIYVSCDPATMARDIAALVGSGYGIKKVQLFDMFPQTHHVETLVLLGR